MLWKSQMDMAPTSDRPGLLYHLPNLTVTDFDRQPRMRSPLRECSEELIPRTKTSKSGHIEKSKKNSSISPSSSSPWEEGQCQETHRPPNSSCRGEKGAVSAGSPVCGLGQEVPFTSTHQSPLGHSQHLCCLCVTKRRPVVRHTVVGTQLPERTR
jgi:hypothetical protein